VFRVEVVLELAEERRDGLCGKDKGEGGSGAVGRGSEVLSLFIESVRPCSLVLLVEKREEGGEREGRRTDGVNPASAQITSNNSSNLVSIISPTSTFACNNNSTQRLASPVARRGW
jgi:hypothetical protein